MTRLLLLACSKAKRPGSAPAVDLYDGPTYRILRKVPPSERPRLLVLSAKYGLIEGSTVIDYYDQRMTEETAAEWRPFLRNVLDDYVGGQRYDSVFVNLGQTYQLAFEPETWDVLRASTEHLVVASGAIGHRLHALSTWLRSTF